MAPPESAITMRLQRVFQQPHGPMFDFSGIRFPEEAFPPRAEWAAEYRRRCERGYARMAGMRIAVTGLARNLGAVLPATIPRIERLCSRFADHRIVVYENDSTDATKSILTRWADANPRVDVSLEDCHDPRNPGTRCLARVARMARYRQQCQERVLDRCGDFDAAIVLDLDVLGGWSEDGIANSFGHDDWDFIGSNGLVYRREGLRANALRQYDMWALRFDADLTPISTAQARRYVYRRGERLVPVTCCFGGMGIYRMDAYRHGHYGLGDLEHAVFNRSLIQNGFSRLYLNPSQILVYGRRHRFGDALFRSLGAAWGTVAGVPAEPWMFPAERRGAMLSAAGRRAA